MSEIKMVPLNLIYPDEQFNSRGPIAPIDVVDLAKSIEEKGLISPVVICPLAANDPRATEGQRFLLVAGYRRYHAHRILKRTEILAVVREQMDEVACRMVNLIENLDRKELNILQEAKAIARLRELGVGEHAAADALHKSRGWVQVRYMLLDLPEEVQQEAAAGVIKQTDIRTVFAMPDRESRLAVAKKIKESVVRGENRNQAKYDAVKRKQTTKKVRNKAEINGMLDHIQETLGNGLYTRCLAWCGGEISDGELFQDLAREAFDRGVPYTAPY